MTKRKRGRPEKRLKINDTPRNLARSFFGLPSTKFTEEKNVQVTLVSRTAPNDRGETGERR